MNTRNPFINRLVQIIGCFTFFAIAATAFFDWPMIDLFSLNSAFFTNLYLWQPLTSIFLIPEFDFGFWQLVDVVFILMLASFLGNQVLDFFGKRRYCIFFISVSFIASLTAVCILTLTGYEPPISMLYPILLAHATFWTMCQPAQNANIWMLFPISSKWILILTLLGTIGKNLLLHHFALAAAYTASFLTSYFVAIMYFHLTSPIVKLWPFEASLRRCSLSVSRFWNWKIMAKIRKWRNTTTIE